MRTLLAMVLLCAAPVLALPVPEPGYRVHDYADVLSPGQQQELESLSRDVDRATTAELGIVTVASLEDKTIDEYAHELFNAWGIGKVTVNNGVLLLVAPKERRARIEVGYGLEPLLPDGLCGAILDRDFLPAAREGRYADGVMATAGRLANELKSRPADARGFKGSDPGFLRPALPWLRVLGIRMSVPLLRNLVVLAVSLVGLILGIVLRANRIYPSFLFFLVLVLVTPIHVWNLFLDWSYLGGQPIGNALLGLVVVVMNAKWYLRWGPHSCSHCGARLKLLSDDEDDAFLKGAEGIEEQLGSVDYDVWLCPVCSRHDAEAYRNLLDHVTECPHCERQTLITRRKVKFLPVSGFSGEETVTRECLHCLRRSSSQEVIASNRSRLAAGEETLAGSSAGGSGGGGFTGGSGGGGGSFGGGSSGGGGASRGW